MLGSHQGIIIVYQLCYSNYDNSLVTHNSEWHGQSLTGIDVVNLWQGSEYGSGSGYVKVSRFWIY